MKINEGQISLETIVCKLQNPVGISGSADHGVPKLCQVQPQGQGDQRVIFNDQDPHLVTAPQWISCNDYHYHPRLQSS